VPSGIYDRVEFEGRTIVDPLSYRIVDKENVGITTFFLSFYHGFRNAASLMGMIFFAGAAFGVVCSNFADGNTFGLGIGI
ncbi:MAG: hypothetical protein QMB54_02695, partial [Neofamilia sp.]